MSIKKLSGLLCVSLCLFTASAFAETYEIDADHSAVGFKVRHLGISSVRGSFGTFSGTVTYDPKNVEASSTNVSIQASSVDTKQEKRDEHLKSDDFLQVEKHPTLTFVSKKVKKTGDDSFQVIGDLTLLGVTKEVTLDTTFEGMATDPWGFERVAFEATTEIDRKDFGVKYSKLLDTGGLVVGNEVKVSISIEAKRKP